MRWSNCFEHDNRFRVTGLAEVNSTKGKSRDTSTCSVTSYKVDGGRTNATRTCHILRDSFTLGGYGPGRAVPSASATATGGARSAAATECPALSAAAVG